MEDGNKRSIIVSTGDIKKPYEIIGPVFFQVSNKGLLGSTLDRLRLKYYNDIHREKTSGNFSPTQPDWGFLYGEWSVGQNEFDVAFYVGVRELQEKAKRMGGDAITWLRQDIDLDTNGFANFYLQMYGTVVKFTEGEFGNYKIKKIIDKTYLDIVLKENSKAAELIEQKKAIIAQQEDIVNKKKHQQDEIKADVIGRAKIIEEEISELNARITSLSGAISKLEAYGRENTKALISEKNTEIEKLSSQKEQLIQRKQDILSELKPYNKEYLLENKKLQALWEDLKEYERLL